MKYAEFNEKKKIIDDLAANQYYNGTNKDAVNYNIVYTLPVVQPQTYEEYMQGAGDKESINWRKRKGMFQEKTVTYYTGYSMGQFADEMKVETGLQLLTETPYEQGDDERVLVKPERYYRLPIRKRWNTETRHNEVIRWGDGELRHQKVFLAGILLRRILTDITPDQLLYMMVCYVIRYIDNTDGKFGKQKILDICCNCMDASLDNALTEVKASAYHVDAGYAYRTRQSKRQIVGQLNGERMAKEREERYVKIDKWYDAALTDKQNLAILKKHRVNVSARTLTNYKKNRGISKKRL